jgi:hypothetical protein
MRSFVRIDESLAYIARRVTIAYGYKQRMARERKENQGIANGVDSLIGEGARCLRSTQAHVSMRLMVCSYSLSSAT